LLQAADNVGLLTTCIYSNKKLK